MPEIVREGQCRSRDRGGESGKEGYPPAHEAPGRTVSLREINILAAGAGKVDAQLGVTECAGQSANGSNSPDEQHQLRRTKVARQESGGGQNPGANHVRNHERRRADEPDLPQKGCGLSCQWLSAVERLERTSDCPPSHTYTAPVI